MDKEIIFKNKNKSNDLSLIKIFNNQIPNLSRKNANKLNYKSVDNSSSNKINNQNKKINYLNYRQKLFKKCNSRILENKEILPIISIKKRHNIISSPQKERNQNKISLKKIPIKFKNSLNEKKKINISILSDFNNKNKYKSQLIKDESESMKDLLKLKKSKSLIQLDSNEKMNKENIFNKIELFSNSSKKVKFQNLEELKNNETIIINLYKIKTKNKYYYNCTKKYIQKEK